MARVINSAAGSAERGGAESDLGSSPLAAYMPTVYPLVSCPAQMSCEVLMKTEHPAQ